MKLNKEDFRDALSFIWIAIIFFLLTLDVVFPLVLVVIKGIFYLISAGLFLLGIGTIIRSVFYKKPKIEDLTESKNK